MSELVAHTATFSDEAGESSSLLDLIVHGRPKWWKDAACLEAPASVNFFPVRGEDFRPAKRWCEQCLVMWECREWSLQQDALLQGVFGGLSSLDRQRMRRQVGHRPGR